MVFAYELKTYNLVWMDQALKAKYQNGAEVKTPSLDHLVRLKIPSYSGQLVLLVDLIAF